MLLLWNLASQLLVCSNDVETNPGPLAPLVAKETYTDIARTQYCMLAWRG